MSSHHIIRDNQEPALLILQLAPTDEAFLDQILEWSPTVITTTDYYERVIMHGIKVDLVVGPPSPNTENQPNQKHDYFNSPLSDYWINDLINELIRKSYIGLYIFAPSNLCTQIDTKKALPFQISLIDEQFVWKLSHKPIDKWFKAGQKLQSATADIYQKEKIIISKNGLFEVPNSGMVSIKASHAFWWAEYLQ
ncbi:hypothetical protein [Persicobacter psychrovividus]|uniref:Thiamine pyrophosphokinase n=1 Tax=Persicobacter psychrovividus TaxID=387638 RepID=A0ABM7VGL7_9BACT|nr:hypothetical protein PEPS_23890 [Persicobacter psychrovividus]